ncbi:hypothetical protein TrST_g13816 [Triparma strigata]|uniref:Uncharacterized protein n=1 Tax=Triparma strigata TaxID=1606541 RepID=A0A9W7C497_9STRA|nr:hypothetical protein TrST_g13816 [Triparma strigata]
MPPTKANAGKKQNPKKRRKPKQEAITFFAGDVCRYDCVKYAAQQQKWKLITDSAPASMQKACNIYWVDTSTINEFFAQLKPWQRINHFMGMSNIARKSRLAQNLDFMRRKFPKNFQFYPRSFVLPQEVSAFREQFDKKGKAKKTFIVKPDAGCQGRGIYLTRKIAEVDTTMSCVAQHYISKPLLIEEKKFDLRIYVLVASCKPLRIYLFKDGLVRLCTEEYVRPNESNLADKRMHLTNYSINKNSEKFEQNEGDGEEGSKRSIQWFLEWLAKERGEEKVKNMWKKVGEISVKCVMSILPILVREYDLKFGTGDKSGAPAENDDHTVNVLGDYTSKSRPSTVGSIESTVSMQSTESGSGQSEATGSGEDEEEDSGSEDSESGDESDEDDETSASSSAASNQQKKRKAKKETIEGSHCFEILGLDIMFDEKLKPYLIEVNHLPSFGTDSPLDEDIKSRVVEQALSILQVGKSDERVFKEKMKKESEMRLYSSASAKSNMGMGLPPPAGGGLRRKLETAIANAHSSSTTSLISEGGRETSSPSPAVQKARERILEIYKQHAPSKVDKVDALMSKYKGNEEWLVDQVAGKYCVVKEEEEEEEEEEGEGEEGQEGDEVEEEEEGEEEEEEEVEGEEEGEENGEEEEEEDEEEDEEEEEEDDEEEEEEEEDEEDVPESNTPSPQQSVEYEDPMLLSHDKLLFDFDRVYPVPLAKAHLKHPNFEAMKKFIFEKDVQRQMRLKAPLQQRKSVSAAEYELNQFGNNGGQNDGYQSRGDSWITGNAFGRRASEPVQASSTPKAAPTAKQVEAADRLSRGFSTKEKSRGETIASTTSVDSSWYLSERVLKASENAKQMRKRIEMNAQKSAEVAVKPVVFDFSNGYQFGGMGLGDALAPKPNQKNYYQR